MPDARPKLNANLSTGQFSLFEDPKALMDPANVVHEDAEQLGIDSMHESKSTMWANKREGMHQPGSSHRVIYNTSDDDPSPTRDPARFNPGPSLHESIANEGIKRPVRLGTPDIFEGDPGGNAVLLDGHHRTTAAADLGHSWVPVEWETPEGMNAASEKRLKEMRNGA